LVDSQSASDVKENKIVVERFGAIENWGAVKSLEDDNDIFGKKIRAVTL